MFEYFGNSAIYWFFVKVFSQLAVYFQRMVWPELFWPWICLPAYYVFLRKLF